MVTRTTSWLSASERKGRVLGLGAPVAAESQITAEAILVETIIGNLHGAGIDAGILRITISTP